jgi:signal transduction histidine kinase/DNA-binding LacI/PurR family transcriptional regulator/AraC-like DNA-binding protein/response regulator of citrate/malate metabolism
MAKSTPLTIGFLAPTVSEGNGLLLWQSILGQAAASGARLVTFMGGELRYPEPFYRRANQVYELANRQKLDGLIIWTSSLAAFVGDEGIQHFCLQFAPLPVVGIGIPLAGVPSITLESYAGMREAVLHLVQVHGKRRMVFVRGPERHYDAQKRLQAYLDVVAEFGLDQDPGLITPPCRWIERDATKAMRLLVEKRGVQFDSVIGVSDTLAYGAMLYLQEKGYRMPGDIAIVGFDNNPIGRVCSPPLTTVPNLMHQRGQQAVQMLMQKIKGEEVPARITLSTGIKIRQSCGCQDPYIVQAGKPAMLPENLPAADRRMEILKRLQAAVLTDISIKNWPEKILAAFEASLAAKSDAQFLSTLQDLLQSLMSAGLESREWQAALSELRQWLILQFKTQPERIEFGERLIHQGRVMIGEITSRSSAYQEWMRSRRLNDLHRLRLALSTCETLDSLLDILAVELPKLEISCGGLALYLNANEPLEGARLVLAFTKEGRLPQLEGKCFRPSSLLASPTTLDFMDSGNLIVHPLHSGNDQLGFLFVDAGPLEGSSHQVLREQISSALKNIVLVEQNIELLRQARLNQHLAEEANLLKSRFLSIVSHELLTPIVLLVGLSEMMLREGIGNLPALPEAYRQDLTRIHASAQQLGSLVRDVLDLSRSQLGQLTLATKPLNISDVIRPIELVGEQMAISKGLEWQVDLPENLPLVLGDASRLQQVALNLVSNAVKFTSQGFVKIKVEAEDGFITVAVSDTGLSVPTDEQEAIFDEFRQSGRTMGRGFGGLGIGLAICRQLVELHGGKIGVRSSGEEGSGSTFYFSLPVLSAPAPLEPGEPSHTVLILTEQAQRSTILRQHLEQQGFEVRVFEAVQTPGWLESLSAFSQGAVVLDFQNAERGWKVLDELKQNPATQNLPVIFYSLIQEQDRGSILTLDYLVKPVATSTLNQILKRYGITPECSQEPPVVLVVDDEPNIREMHARLLMEHLPGCRVLSASNGKDALEVMRLTPPNLVLLDLRMPEMDGMAVLRAMQAEKNLQGIPVIILTAQRLTANEMAALGESVTAVLSKGVFTTAETLAQVEAALSRNPRLVSENRRLVRKVMAYIHEQFDQPLNRKQLADHAGVSERHLNRCFTQELGVSPLQYLNRYRIQQAKILLAENQASITEIMCQVGFSESSHFARVFRREVGLSPSEYKRRSKI